MNYYIRNFYETHLSCINGIRLVVFTCWSSSKIPVIIYTSIGMYLSRYRFRDIDKYRYKFFLVLRIEIRILCLPGRCEQLIFIIMKFIKIVFVKLLSGFLLMTMNVQFLISFNLYLFRFLICMIVLSIK